MREKLKSIPMPLKKQILSRFIIGFLSLIVAIVILSISKDFILTLPCLLLFVFLIADGGRMLYCCIVKKYIVVSGICLNIERTLRKRIKSLTIQTTKGNMKLVIRKSIKHVNEGDNITVYLPLKARIYEQDNKLVALVYYAISVISTK